MSSKSASTAIEPYIYMGHGKAPENVTHVIVDTSVTVIPRNAFEQCYQLKEVVLPLGLIEIRTRAFNGCTSLKDINFPSTLRIIEKAAFYRCGSMVRADFNEGLLTIETYAFGKCQSIIYLKIPSTVTTIGYEAFGFCSALKDVQLSEGLRLIESRAFYMCRSLLRINIPSSVITIGHWAFQYCNCLRNISIAPDSTLGPVELWQSHLLDNHHQVSCSVYLLRSRFHNLPLHRICFFRIESANFLKEVNEHATKEKLAQVDHLGMTPLHILACSGRYYDDVELYKLFIGKFPEALLIKDKWGEAPLKYAILSEAPREIIHFLMGRHSKCLNRSLPFDFSTMVENLATKPGTSAESVQSIIQAQRTHFPTLKIEWKRIVNDNAEGGMHVKMFGVLVEASLSNFNQMSSGHRKAMDSLINDVSKVDQERQREARDRVRHLIATSVQHFVEATTMLELALWQVAIDEFKHDKEGNHCKKRAKIDDTEVRKNCRIKCKAEDIIPLILPFL